MQSTFNLKNTWVCSYLINAYDLPVDSVGAGVLEAIPQLK